MGRPDRSIDHLDWDDAVTADDSSWADDVDLDSEADWLRHPSLTVEERNPTLQ
jgi:hypothetical protein